MGRDSTQRLPVSQGGAHRPPGGATVLEGVARNLMVRRGGWSMSTLLLVNCDFVAADSFHGSSWWRALLCLTRRVGLVHSKLVDGTRHS